ncbi:MAG: hypothetical protein QY322_01050 [bacterium]|nr:MAG: hypothetical protein QY322_01050 [bacterium]
MRTKYTKQLCVDIVFLDSVVEDQFLKFYEKILERSSYSHGSIYRHENETRTKLNGPESSVLIGMASKFIDGEIIGVDGVLNDGINVSANVTGSEAGRIKGDKNRFRVKAEIDISI